jgi:hypothetical protein
MLFSCSVHDYAWEDAFKQHHSANACKQITAHCSVAALDINCATSPTWSHFTICKIAQRVPLFSCSVHDYAWKDALKQHHSACGCLWTTAEHLFDALNINCTTWRTWARSSIYSFCTKVALINCSSHVFVWEEAIAHKHSASIYWCITAKHLFAVLNINCATSPTWSDFTTYKIAHKVPLLSCSVHVYVWEEAIAHMHSACGCLYKAAHCMFGALDTGWATWQTCHVVQHVLMQRMTTCIAAVWRRAACKSKLCACSMRQYARQC